MCVSVVVCVYMFVLCYVVVCFLYGPCPRVVYVCGMCVMCCALIKRVSCVCVCPVNPVSKCVFARCPTSYTLFCVTFVCPLLYSILYFLHFVFATVFGLPPFRSWRRATVHRNYALCFSPTSCLNKPYPHLGVPDRFLAHTFSIVMCFLTHFTIDMLLGTYFMLTTFS